MTQSTAFSLLTRSIIALSCILSYARITALYKNYHAPMEIYSWFQTYELPRLALERFPTQYTKLNITDSIHSNTSALTEFIDRAQFQIELETLSELNLNLCLGKEWYRFPSHWLVPDVVNVEFIESEFKGILPKKWLTDRSQSAAVRKGLFGKSTNLIPSFMNDQNQQEFDRFVNLNKCHYLIDLDFPLRKNFGSALEPRFAVDSENWQRVVCRPFLDQENSKRWSRAINLPLPGWQANNQFGDYCLLRNKNLL